MKELLQKILQNFRLMNPQTRDWTDEEVVDAMFLILSEQPGSGISVAGRHADGGLIYRIARDHADVSDGSG